jgi:MFS family permease
VKTANGIIGHARSAVGRVRAHRSLSLLLVVSALLFPVIRLGLFIDQPFLEHLGFERGWIGYAYGAKDLVAAITAVLTSRLLTVLGERRLLITLSAVTLAASVSMAVASSLGAAVLVLVPTAVFGVYSPLVRIYINDRVTDSSDRATVLSIEGMARRLGFATLSPLVGAFFDLWSLRGAFLLSAVCAGASLVVTLVMTARGADARQSMT